MAQWSVRLVCLLAAVGVDISARGGRGAPGVIHQVCQWETFHAQCDDDEIIVISQARYGRMRIGRCVEQSMGHVGCSRDVTSLLHARCSGRRECEVSVPDRDLDSTEPCQQLKTYLEAQYTCQTVESLSGSKSQCHTCDYVKVKGTSGYLSNYVTQQTGCGSTSCPWLISGLPGQRVQVSLQDYGVRGEGGGGRGVTDPAGVCKVYAVIKERAPSTGGRPRASSATSTVCGGGSPGEIYMSEAHEVEVRLIMTGRVATGERRPLPGVAGAAEAADEEEVYFLLKYQVSGCPKLTPPDGVTVLREDGRVAEMECAPSGERWMQQCNGTHWQGAPRPCQRGAEGQATELPFSVEDTLSSGISVAIIVGVAFVICALVVVIGLACYKLCGKVPPEENLAPHTLYHTPQAALHEHSLGGYSTTRDHSLGGYPLCDAAMVHNMAALHQTPEKYNNPQIVYGERRTGRNQYEQICEPVTKGMLHS